MLTKCPRVYPHVCVCAHVYVLQNQNVCTYSSTKHWHPTRHSNQQCNLIQFREVIKLGWNNAVTNKVQSREVVFWYQVSNMVGRVSVLVLKRKELMHISKRKIYFILALKKCIQFSEQIHSSATMTKNYLLN